MLNENIFSLKKYKILKKIGSGSYSDVWLAQNIYDTKQYVIKNITLSNKEFKNYIFAKQECNILAKLHHPSIVSYIESFEDNAQLSIVMEYCEKGDLFSRLHSQNKKLIGEEKIMQWLIQITMALQYMHSKNILHRDLKTQNVFLTKYKLIKVGDFGIAKVLNNFEKLATTIIGTPYYMSPEIFLNKPYSYKSDIWALGCVAYEMVSLKHAFDGKDLNTLSYKIINGKMPDIPETYSNELKHLIRSMLNADPEKRPTTSQILRYKFMRHHIKRFLIKIQDCKLEPLGYCGIKHEATTDISLGKFTECWRNSNALSDPSDDESAHCVKFPSASPVNILEKESFPPIKNQLSNIEYFSQTDLHSKEYSTAQKQYLEERIEKELKNDNVTQSIQTYQKNISRNEISAISLLSPEKYVELDTMLHRLASSLRLKANDSNLDFGEIAESNILLEGDNEIVKSFILTPEETIKRKINLRCNYNELRSECVRQVGLENLRNSYELMDKEMPSIEREILLRDILGNSTYDSLMSTIWQLKLLDEQLLWDDCIL